ncbi:MAG: hypothetical protein U1F43_12205 [Myxococcota bacterium]
MRYWLALCLVVGACDDSASQAPDTSNTADSAIADDVPPVAEEVVEQVFTPAPDGGQQLLTDEYTLQPGEEKYYCYTFFSPADEVGVVAVDNQAGRLVHHVALFQSLGGLEDEGFHECNVLIRLTWMPIWAGGKGGNDLQLPPQVAFKVPALTKYVVQYHLLNATTKPITERSAINLAYTHDLTGYQPAGIFAIGQFALNIPMDASGYSQDTGCTVSAPLHVFAVFPHMHQLGTKLELFQGPSQDDLHTAYAIDPWPFGDQPFDRVDFDIAAGDYVRSRCTWDNTTGHDVGFGESSLDEMCFLVLFAYPMPEIDGCGF